MTLQIPPPPPPPPKQRNKRVTSNPKGGRPRAIETAVEMLQHCEDYLDWCQSHPLEVEKSHMGADGVEYYIDYRTRAPTIGGFCQYVGVVANSLYKWRKSKDDEYAEAADLVHNAIRTNQLEGGMANIYNAGITSRITELTEHVKTDLNVSGSIELQVEMVELASTPMLMHPHEDPTNPSGLTFTQEQLDAGVLLPPKNANPITITIEHVAVKDAGKAEVVAPWV